MTVLQAALVSVLIGWIVLAERVFPFALFSKRAPGKLIYFFERYVPPVVMLGLLIYSLSGISFSELVLWVPALAGTGFALVSYIWKKNTFVSIFGATIIYMVLLRVL